uniref:Uncharacterized protein n=1 Tax=Gouania willdenowi TaxID=441366 RepID=A0A8C5N7E9_GOUWI
MAFSSRTDSPKLPDFSMLKRLVKDHLVYLLEQVGPFYSCECLLEDQGVFGGQ